MLILGLSMLVGQAHAAVPNALLARDGVVCSDLGPATPALRDELAALAIADVQPSYVPMRAAGCLVDLFATDPALPAIVTPWVQDPALGGLGLLVLIHAEAMPLSAELDLAKAAAASTDARWGPKFRDRISRSLHPEVRAVLDGAAGAR